MKNQPTLARKIGLPLLAFYGLGTILGAGIYVLVGKVAGSAGLLAPLAFLVSALIAFVTGLSYAQLSALFPKSGGEVVYLSKAINNRHLAIFTGILIILTGTVSSATLTTGFTGYFSEFFKAPEWLIICCVVLVLGAVAIHGIAESLWLCAIMTLIEVSGLLIIIVMGADSLATIPANFSTYLIPISFHEITMVFSGAFLAFYAFIGFEDMVNVAEEVKQPEKNMPRGIFIAITVSTLLYMLIAFISVASVPLEELSKSKAPLTLLIQDHATLSKAISIISMFAIVNGVLIQIIMASRVCYGMSSQGLLPTAFGHINNKTRTPIFSTIFIIILVISFALWLPLVTLAKLTSFIILIVFILVNMSLLIIKHRKQYALTGKSFPVLGILLCTTLLLFQLTF